MTNQKFTLKCIHCQNEISLCTGLAPGVNYESIRLQAKEIGVEVYCNQCKKTFLFHEPADIHEQANLHEPHEEIASPVSNRKTVDSNQSNRDYLLP